MDQKTPPLASKQLEPLITPLSDIRPHPLNYKIHTPDQIKDLRASLKAFGCTQPIKANLEGFIVAGHGMYQLYLEDGYTHAPVMFEALGEQLSKAYLIADNETARRAQTDSDRLGSLLQEVSEIPDFDIEATGFELEDINSLLEFPDGPDQNGEFNESGYPNNYSQNGSFQNENNQSSYPEAPPGFKEYDENIQTEHRCPKCGYEWSGSSR